MHTQKLAFSSIVANVAKKSSHGSSPVANWSSTIGIVTAIIGNILISFALNTQRYAHVRLEREYNEKRGHLLNHRDSSDAQRYGTIEESDSPDQTPKARGRVENGSAANETEDDHMQDSFRSDDTLKPNDKDDEEDRESYLKSPIWWAGIIMMTLGETGNFLAYAFAPASIVSPLGVVALISNCLIAPLMLKEKFRRRDFFGVIVAIAGAVTVVLSAKQSETQLRPDELWSNYVKRWEFLVYVIITIVAIIALAIASPRYGKRTVLVDLGLVGLFGGYTALSTKGVASLLSTELWKAFAYPIFYVLVVILVGSAILQIRYLNKALQNFNSTQVIPTQFVLFTLSVIIGSAVLYRDFESTTTDRAIKFIAGCLLTFFGVYLITSKRQSPEDAENDDYERSPERSRLINQENEEADERTPLTSENNRRHFHKKEEPQAVTAQDSRPQTPPSTPPRSPHVPSISVTPALNSTNPWSSSTTDLPPPSETRPYTPSRSISDLTGTPFYTPQTSRPFQNRSVTSIPDPETPTRKGRTASPPKPDRAAVVDAEAERLSTLRSARNSITRLMPGPLLAPLSSSLSGIVAESLRRGEGSPLSVRQRLRRSRLRSGAAGRRRSIAPGDEESGLAADTFGRSATRQSLPPTLGVDSPAMESAPDVTEIVEGEGSTDKKKSRLRSLSEGFGSMLGGKRNGKKREDEGGGEGSGVNGNAREGST